MWKNHEMLLAIVTKYYQGFYNFEIPDIFHDTQEIVNKLFGITILLPKTRGFLAGFTNDPCDFGLFHSRTAQKFFTVPLTSPNYCYVLTKINTTN